MHVVVVITIVQTSSEASNKSPTHAHKHRAEEIKDLDNIIQGGILLYFCYSQFINSDTSLLIPLEFLFVFLGVAELFCSTPC